MRCDVFEVTGATNTTFNGEYEVSPFTVTGALEDEVAYENKNRNGTFIFKNNAGWAIGSRDGDINYSGIALNEIKICRSGIKNKMEKS